MKIILAEKEYTAPAPMTGLWYATQKNKTEHKQRVANVQALLKEIEPCEDIEKDDNSMSDEVDKKTIELTKKLDDNKRITLEGQISIIVNTFKNDNVTLETILDYLPLADVKNKYFEIENWLNDILAGRTAKLPNEETPTA